MRLPGPTLSDRRSQRGVPRSRMSRSTEVRSYSPAGLAPDLRGGVGPIEPVLAQLDPLIRTPIRLSETQFNDLVAFVRNGLLDPRAKPENLRSLVPVTLPSGNRTHQFDF